MEVLLAITGKDFVLTCSDSTSARSIVVMKRKEDKTKQLSKNTLMVYSGEPGDTVQFSEFIQKNIKLYSMKNGLDLSTQSIATFVRKELASSLRSRNPYHINVLIAGTSPTGVPELYWIDYISNMCKLSFAAHGYASYFCMSTMDRYWKPDMTLDEAKQLLQKCLDELKVRFIANLPEFNFKLITKEGIKSITLQ